jgi:hypothetical protein
VTKRLEDAIVLQQERTGHALNIAGREAYEIAFEPGHQHAENALAIEVLAQFGTSQPEDVIEFAIGIGEAR